MLAVALSGCGLSGPAHGPPDARAAAVIDMGLDSFTPSTATVTAGQTVEWRNTSPITHSVSFEPTAASDPADAAVPPGVQPFTSGDIAAGAVFEHTFDAAGTYRYFCTHHEGLGMVGTIVVR